MPTALLVSGQSLYYLEANSNSGSCVLLLHGLGSESSSWQFQISALMAAGFRILAPDTPGFGHSPYTGEGTSIPQMSQTIHALLEYMGISKAHVVGISMGGVQALQLALDFPNVVEKLVLVNTFARLPFDDLRVIPYMLMRAILMYLSDLPTQARAVAKRVFPNPEHEWLRQELVKQICHADPRAYRASMRAIAGFNVTHRLHEIQAPTLIVTGNQDTTVPMKVQKELVESIPGAEQVILNAGHAASVEVPQQFNKILLDYLLNRQETVASPGSNQLKVQKESSFLEV
jgi:pimeloyl-ACP methyl ester carboxylesterase